MQAVATATRSTQSMFREFVAVLGSRLSMTLFSLITSVIVARSIGPEGKGALAAITAYSNFIVIILCTGLRQSTVHFVGGSAHDRRDVIATLLMLGASLAVLATVVGAWVLATFPSSKLDLTLVCIATMLVPLSLAQNYSQGLFIGLKNLPALNRATILQPLCGFVGTIAFVGLLSWGLFGVLIAQLVASVAVCSFSAYVLWPHLKVVPRLIPGIARDLLKLGVVAGTTLLVLNIHLKIDIILLEQLVPQPEVGNYSLAANLAEMLLKLPAALGVVIWSRSASGEAGLEQKVLQAVRFSVPLMACFGLLLGVAIEWLIPLVYGQGFEGSISATRWLLPGIMSLSVFNLIHYDLTGKGRPLLSLAALSAGAVLNVLLNLILIPRYGATGAALASSLSYSLSAVIVSCMYVRAYSLSASLLYRIQPQDLALLRSALGRFRASNQ